jgi:hypothetical protein
VPKPHTPFQWAPQLDPEDTDARLAQAARRRSTRPKLRPAIGFRYHDGKPG